jgi:formate-dependent nitrite reductase membrane component NrfD
MDIVLLVSGFVSGYFTNTLFIKNSIFSGLIIGILFTIPFLLLGGIPPLFITIIISGGIGGGIGGYFKIQREIGNSKGL